MQITRTAIGTTAGHDAQDPTVVEAYTIDSGAGLSVTVWTYGATLVEVLVPDREGCVANVALRRADLAAYERPHNRFLGATLGRYARCIAEGVLPLGGVDWQLDRNAGRHHFHGGSIGFDRFVWDADAEQRGGRLSLRLRLERPDGDQGYPGGVGAETVYAVDRCGRLTFEHRASVTASTVVDMTNHACWNLAGGGAIDEHLLRVSSDRVLLVDDELIPAGMPVPVAGTALDYSEPRRLAGSRLDHCFVLDGSSPAAELFEPRSGRVMRIFTDQPGLQVYSGDGLPEPRSGLSLQTGAWPNSPRRRDFPSSRLDPGQVYRHATTHEFAVR